MPPWLLELLVAIALALPVHEGGHWLAARALGARDVTITRAGRLGAAVHATFPDDARRARATFLIAGAAANVVAGAAALVLGAPLGAGIHWVFAALMLVPTPGSDGARLLSLVGERR